VKLLVHSNQLPQTNISEVLNKRIGHHFRGNWAAELWSLPRAKPEGSVFRDEDELSRIREYIIYNPLKWAEDFTP